MGKFVVISIATGSRELDSWWFDTEEQAKTFCVHHTGKNGYPCFIVEGELKCRIELDKMPVKIVQFPEPIPEAVTK